MTLTARSEGTYYLHVLTVDNAGNKTQTVSNAISFNKYITFTLKSYNGSKELEFKAPENVQWYRWVQDYGGSGYGFGIHEPPAGASWITYKGTGLSTNPYGILGSFSIYDIIEDGSVYYCDMD